MNNSINKYIESLNNPEYKFLISLKKNRNRKSENKSIAEGYRENSNLIDSSLNVDTLYICPELFVGENNEKLIRILKIFFMKLLFNFQYFFLCKKIYKAITLK